MRAVRSVVNRSIHRVIENKYLTYFPSTEFASVGTSWTLRIPFTPSTGTDIDDRIGRKATLRAFQFKGVLSGGQSNSIADDNSNVFRIVIGTCISGFSLAGFNVNSALLSTDTAGLLTKLRDEVIPLTSPGPDSTGYMPVQRKVDIYIPMNMVVTWDSTTGTDWNTNLFVACCSDSAAVPHPGFVQGIYRVTYEDG